MFMRRNKVFRVICTSAIVFTAMALGTIMAQEETEEIVLANPIEILSDTLIVQIKATTAQSVLNKK